MAELENESQTPPPLPHFPVTNRGGDATSTDRGRQLAAALACVPLIGGILFYVIEKRDEFVRFYAVQSIILGFTWILFTPAFLLFWAIFDIASKLLSAIFGAIPSVGGPLLFFWSIVMAIVHVALLFLWLAGNAVFVIAWIITTVNAFTNVRWEIPYIGPIARKQVESGTA